MRWARITHRPRLFAASRRFLLSGLGFVGFVRSSIVHSAVERPYSAPQPRMAGGLAIHVVRELMGEVGGQRYVDKNVVTLLKGIDIIESP